MTEPVSRPISHACQTGDCLYTEGESVSSLAILVQGRLGLCVIPDDGTGSMASRRKEHAYCLFEIDRNVFLGASDLITDGRSGCTCVALDTCTVLQYPLSSPDAFWHLMATQKDYGTYALQSIGLLLSQIRSAILSMQERTEWLRIRTENLAMFLWHLRDQHALSCCPTGRFFQDMKEQLALLKESGISRGPRLDPAFLDEDHGESLLDPIPGNGGAYVPDAAEYAIRLNAIPLEIRKGFFGSDARLTARHIREAADEFNSMLALCRATLAQAERMLARLFCDSTEHLYHAFSQAASELAAAGQNPDPALAALDEVISIVSQASTTCQQTYRHTIPIDLAYLTLQKEQLLVRLAEIAGGTKAGVSAAALQALPDELKGSAEALLSYAGLEGEPADTLLAGLAGLRTMTDRFSPGEEARALRDSLTAPFRLLYEAVLRKTFEDSAPSRLVTMFLHFGFVDEWLLTPDQTLKLYRLADRLALMPAEPDPRKPNPAEPAILHLPQWLRQVRERKREPSRNAFDMDYSDVFRDLRRKGQLSDKDKTAYDGNVEARFTFELDIQLGENQKNCFGKPGLFCPVLHDAMVTRDPDMAVVTPEKIRQALLDILAVDPTAFHREIHFQDPRGVIEKERIQKAVAPEFLLLPTFGSRAMMWQEIAGRSRTSPGRLLLPALTDENLETMLVRLVGSFRWELCRTMMGTAWNDITLRSLTSEYADYLQCYKTNKELSDEAKARVKAQIAKYRGNTREQFAADYETWIRNESRGNLRLNKVVRRILFRYCPFGKDIRNQLGRHPAFSELIQAREAHHAKELGSLERRYARYRGASGSLHPDLEENLHYFRGL